VTKIVGDRYAGEFPRELFRKHGIAYVPSEKPKSELYLETLPALKAHRIELLDLPRLIQQFLGLERRTSRAGRDSVDHAPRSHDDLVNAVAGVCVAVGDGPSDAIPQGANLMARPYQPTNWAARELGGSGDLWAGTGDDPSYAGDWYLQERLKEGLE